MKASSLFLRTGVVAALAGMVLGIGMGIAQDHSLRTVHVHVNLVGWASMFLFGLYYLTVPEVEERWARIHYAVATGGFIIFMTGLTGIYLGHPLLEPLAIAGSLLTLVSMVLFAWNVFSTTKSGETTSPLSSRKAPAAAVEPNAANVSWRQLANIL